MLLKSALDLKRNIDESRRKMYSLITNKGIYDPVVIKVSKELDEKIKKLQKIISYSN